MSRRNSAKLKVGRRLGVNLWGSEKSSIITKNYPPGQHGPLGKRKSSDYGNQLRAKQQLKKYYGEITEKQFRKVYEEAVRLKGDTSENLIGLLERRLDAIIYRANFVPTIFAARQFVNHKHVLVNGKCVNISSYRVQIGDVIEVKEKSRQIPIFMEASQKISRDLPDYLDVNLEKGTVKLLRIPPLADVPYPVVMEPNLVIEFYSR